MQQQIPELRQESNGFWYIFWTDRRRSKRISTRTRDMAEAKAFYAQWLVMDKSMPPIEASGLTVADLWNLYDTKYARANISGLDTFNHTWKKLKPHFGILLSTQINQNCVDDYIRKRKNGEIGEPSVDATIKRELGALKTCLNWCASPKRSYIKVNEIPSFDIPPDSPPRDRWLKKEELKKLFDTALVIRRGKRISRVERFLWLALETAARKSAICELTWDRVDFETRVIDYNDIKKKATKKRRVAVPISDTLLPILKQAYKERKNEYVLDNKAGIWRTVHNLAEAAGLKDVSPHVLRHTAATHMARNGVPLWQIAGVLGNSIVMVEKVYAKHCPDGLVDAVNSISSGFKKD